VKLVNGKQSKMYFSKRVLNIGNYFMDIYLIEDSKRSLFIESDIMNFDSRRV
jgi:hypothetical protein